MADDVTSASTSLDALVARAWAVYDYADRAGHEFVVRPSLPILFFGDSEAYFRSDLRIVTVGLNPSRAEFPVVDPFLRFPAARPSPRNETTIAALNAYFRTEPYKTWFNSYEPVLNGAGASYYSMESNVALHTDICSPLASDPTWNALSSVCRDQLTEEGHALWHDLIHLLEPDAIVLSIARHYLSQIQLTSIGDWHPFYTLPPTRTRTRPYVVEQSNTDVTPTRRTQLFFGRAAQLPFGTLSAAERRLVGGAIRRSLDER